MQRYKNTWTIIGLLLVIVGWGPLLAIIMLASIGLWPDPNPNPVGPGLLFFVTSWPAVICLLIGITKARRQKQLELGDSPQVQTEKRERQAQKPLLNDEELEYVSSSSFGGGFGLIYFAYMKVPSAFFRHFWDNLFWNRTVANARLWAWEAGDWTDFESFKQRSNQIDVIAASILGISVIGLLFLLA